MALDLYSGQKMPSRIGTTSNPRDLAYKLQDNPEEAKNYYTLYTWEDFDWLINKYPRFAPQIMEARTKGIRDDIIARFLEEQIEPQFNFIAKSNVVNNWLGRTSKSMEQERQFEEVKQFQAYKQAFPDKSDQDITNAIWLSQNSGISTANILRYPELFNKLSEGKQLNYKWIGFNDDPEWYKANPIWIGANNYHYTREINRMWYSHMRGKISREEAFARDKELSKNILQIPVVQTPLNWSIEKGAGIITQGLYTGMKGWASGLVLAPIGYGVGSLVGNPHGGAALFARIGANVAAADELWQLATGGAYREIVQMLDDNGQTIQDEDAIKGAAALSGVVTVAVELIGLPAISKSLGINKLFHIPDTAGLSKEGIVQSLMTSEAARKTLAKVWKQYLRDGVTWGTVNNLIETYTGALGTLAAQKMSGQSFSKWNQEHPIEWKKLGYDTFIESVAGFSVAGLPNFVRGVYRVNQALAKTTKLINQIAEATNSTPQEVEQQIAEGIAQAREDRLAREQPQTQQPPEDTQEQPAPVQEVQQDTPTQEQPIIQPEVTEQPAQEQPTQQELPVQEEQPAQEQEQTPYQDLPAPLNADYVYVPTKELQAYLAEHEGVDIQGAFQVDEETGMPREQFEKLKAEHSDFTNTILNDIRYGAKAATITEGVKADIPQPFSQEVQGIVNQVHDSLITTGADNEHAEIASNIVGMIAQRMEAEEGVIVNPPEIKTAEQVQTEQLAEQAAQNDMSRVNDENYDVLTPSTWTDKQRAANLLKAAQEGKFDNLSLAVKTFIDRLAGWGDLDETDADDTNAPMKSILRAELKDYQRTLKTANQDAIDLLSSRTDLDTERYEINAKFPRGRSNNPDVRYQTPPSYDGTTTIDVAEHKGNLYFKVKREGVRQPFTFAIKNFRDADFGQVINDLANGVTDRGAMMGNIPVVQNIIAALEDFSSRLDIQTAPEDNTQIETVQENLQPVSETTEAPVEDLQPVDDTAIDETVLTQEEPQITTPNEETENVIPDEEVIEDTVEKPEVHTIELRRRVDTHSMFPLLYMGMSEKAMENLYADQANWSKTVENILADSEISTRSQTHTYVMQTPQVFSLIGIEPHNVTMLNGKLLKVQKDHPTITKEILQQVLLKIADPLAIIQSSPDSTNPNGIVIMTDVKDTNGATVIVVIHPESKGSVKAGVGSVVNKIASIYPQSSSGKPKNGWFREEVLGLDREASKDGEKVYGKSRLLYINPDGAQLWAKETAKETGVNEDDIRIMPTHLPDGVKTRYDLIELWQKKENREAGYYKTDETGTPLASYTQEDINLIEAGRAMVQLFTDPKLDITVHEIGHYLFGIVDGLAEAGHLQMQKDREYVLGRAGVTLEQWLAEKPNTKGGAREKAHEWFADAFSLYLAEGGKASTPYLQDVLDRAKNELVQILEDMQKMGFTLNGRDRELFERLLAIPARENNTVAEAAVQDKRINEEISSLKEQQRILTEQMQRDADASNQQDNDTLPVELDDDTVNAVENYAIKDLDLSPYIKEIVHDTDKIRTARGTEVEVRYRLVDADQLITSHNEMGDINPAYPSELQPRQRSRAASRTQINKIANDLDPTLLGHSRIASIGAPIVGSDNIVESGNGRVLALRKSYQSGKAQGYRQWLKEHAHQFGLNADEVDSLKNPVLVRERITEVDRAAFAAEANEADISGMSQTENAAADADKITNDMLALFDSSKPISENTDFVQAFAKIIPEADLAEFTKSNGEISRLGVNRIVNALLIKAYGTSELLDRMIESYDNNMRNISTAIIAAAPSIAALQNSNFDASLFIGEDVAQAISTLDTLRQDGKSVQEYISQPDLFDSNISDEAKTILQFFDKNKSSYKRIAAGLINYVNGAMNEAQVGQGLLFEDSARDKATILDEALRHAEEASDTSSAIQEPVSSSFFERINAKGTVEPTVPVNPHTFAAFMTLTDAEGTMNYIKKRKKYLNARKAKLNADAELARIDYYIERLNEAFDEELKQGKRRNITQRDLRSKFNEGIREGRSRERETQLGRQAQSKEKIKSRYVEKLQASEEKYKAEIQKLSQEKNEKIAQLEQDIADLQEREDDSVYIQQLYEEEKNAIIDSYEQEITELAEKSKQEIKELQADLEEQHEADIESVWDDLWQRLIETERKAEAEKEQAITELQEQFTQEQAEIEAKHAQELTALEEQHSKKIQALKDKYAEGRQRWAEQRKVLTEKSKSRLDKQAARYKKRIDAYQERIARMTETRKSLRRKHDINRMVKRMVGMQKSQSISWDSLQELKQLVDSFSYDKDEQNIQRREFIRTFLEEFQDDEGERYTDAEEFAEEHDITPEEIDEFSSHIYLADMTLGEVRELFKAAKRIYAQGREEYKIWKANRQAQRNAITDKLVEAVRQKWPDPEPGSGKTITEKEDLYHKYKLGKAGEYIDSFYISSMTPGRFLETLGESFREVLGDGFNMRIQDITRHIGDRIDFVMTEFQKAGVDPLTMGKVATTINGEDFTVQQVMGIYMGWKNDFTKNAILYGNFLSNAAERHVKYLTEQDALTAISKILMFINEPDNAKYKLAADALMRDFDLNVDRIREAEIKDFNRGFDKQPNYSPMFRFRHQSSGGFQINTETEELARSSSPSQLFQKVADGFTRPRMVINPEKQQPISINAFDNWQRAMREEEYQAGLGGYAADVFSALTTTTTEHESVQQMIEERIGANEWQLIKEIYNNSVNDNAALEAEAADKFFGWLTGARSFAYVAYNPVSILSQTTSYFLALPYSNRGHMFRSLANYMEMLAQGRAEEFLENIYQKYPELRYSSGDPQLRAVNNRYKYGQKYGPVMARYLDLAYRGTAVLDRVTKAIVFDIVYNSRKDDGMSENDAIRMAIRAVQDTQPASNAREMTAFNRSRGLPKAIFFQFMNALAPIYNAAVVDVARNIASPTWNHIKAAAFSLIGVALALGTTGLIKDGLNGNLPTGEERDDGGTDNWWRWFVDTKWQNLLNTIPLLNSDLVEWYNRARGNRVYRASNRVLEPFDAAAKALRSLGSEKGFDWDNATKAVSLFGGKIPYRGVEFWLKWLGLIDDNKDY